MCKLISFFHNPISGDIKVYDLLSHENTKQHHNLNENIWCEGHYLPDGTIEARVYDKIRQTQAECEEQIKTRYPTFTDFLNWCLEQEIADELNLSKLTSLDHRVKLPKEIGLLDLGGLTALDYRVRLPKKIRTLNLSGLTSLDHRVKLPAEIIDWLDLRGLTTLDHRVKFPEKIKWLDLSGLKTLDYRVKFPKEIDWLDLSGLTSLDHRVKFPKEIRCELDLSGLTLLDRRVKLPEKIGKLFLTGQAQKDWLDRNN